MATQPSPTLGGRKTYVAATVSTEATGYSDVIDLGGYSLCSFNMSTAWTAADVAFRASAQTSSELQSVFATTAAVQLAYNTTGSQFHVVDPYLFAGVRYLQLVSVSTADPTTAVAQAAERSIVLGVSPVNPIK